MGFFNFFRSKKEAVSDRVVGLSSRRVARTGEELANSALWSCVINLARLYATLPLHVYRVDSAGKRTKLESGILVELLRRPNAYMTSYEWRFVMGYNFEMHGEAIALIQRSSTGYPIALWPLSPHAIVGSWSDGQLRYTLAVDGSVYRPEDILILRNTPVGYGAGQVLDPIYYASSDIELEQKCKELQAEFYEGASVVGNLITVPQSFSDEVKDKLRKLFGSMKGYRSIVLDERVKVTPIQISQADITKLSEAQKWTAAEVARRFNVPPFFIGDTTGTYNNSEQQGIMMVTYCLQPRVTAWEVALDGSLCGKSEYLKFSLSGLMRGDHAARSAYYHNAIMDGYMSINDVRRLEDMDPIGEEGDVHFFPLNYASVQDVASGRYTGGGSSIWDLPASSESEHKSPRRGDIRTKTPETPVARIKEERRRHDLAYIAEAQAPAQSNRQKIEKLIRAQIRAEIEKIRELIATGAPTDSVVSDFKAWLDAHAKELSPQYQAIYLDIIRKMVPVVQAETGKEAEVSDEKMAAFATSYADSMAQRVAGSTRKTVEDSIDTEEFDSQVDSFQQDYPVEASDEEVNRSSNAFSIFLFSALQVSVFHVVASPTACSFCKAIDGKVASVDGYVITQGSDVDTGDGIRHVSRNYRHPPFHSHCRCSVAPGE